MTNLHEPPVFRSLKEMEAWEEGDQQYSVCALCGCPVSDDAVLKNVTDVTGATVLAWLCQDCWSKQEA